MNEKYSHQFRVYYEDTDAGGVVYHANYLNFFERTRTEWLRSKGLQQRELSQTRNLVMVIRKMEIDFIKPARLDDILTIDCRPVLLKKASMVVEQQMFRGQVLLSKATAKIVCLRADAFKPTAFPSDLLKELIN